MEKWKCVSSFFLLLLLVAFGVVPFTACAFWGSVEESGTLKDIPVEVVADQLEFVKAESKIIGKGNVLVTYGDSRLTCDYAEVYSTSKKVYAEGHVLLERKTDSLRGEKGYYDFAQNKGSFPGGQFVEFPYYGSGAEMEQVNEDKIVIQDGYLTSCDLSCSYRENPHYDLKASKFVVYPDDKVVAHGVQLRVWGKPIMWLPMLQIPLTDNHAPFHVQPGYSTEHGAYALCSKGYTVNESVKGKLHADYRSMRGMAFGNDLDYESDLLGKGMMRFYYADDHRAPNYKMPGPYDNRMRDSRYRISLKHTKQLTQHTNFTAGYNNFSDPYLVKDFFTREYREEVSPETYATVTYNRSNFSLLTNVEKRINHYESATEKLPEIRFNWNNQEIQETDVFYKNETSFIGFNKKVGSSDSDTDVVRFDSFHEFSYPKRIFFLSVKPFMNWRGSYYSKNVSGEENMSRQVFGGGVDLTTKFYRLFNVDTNFLNLHINKLRHVVQPSIGYNSIRHRTVLPGQIIYNDSSDSLDDLDSVTLGLGNRLQTKRSFGDEMKTVNLVSCNTYLNYSFKDESQSGSAFLTWTSNVEFRPYDWFISRLEADYDVPNNEFSTSKLEVELRQEGKWHFFLQNAFTKNGSKLMTMDAMVKLNELWGVGGYMRVEFDEANITEEWEVRATRDLHCWLLDFGYNTRRSEIDKYEPSSEVFFELMLKAFPDYLLKSGNQATYSRSRIGDTVSGAELVKAVEPLEKYAMDRY